MNQLTKMFDGQNLTIIESNGEPNFLLKDVCNILELGQVAGVKRRLGDDVISNHPILDNLGRTQQATFVNEDGLYDVILDSRKPEAKRFRKWITSEVLPSIRKHGAYMTPETIEKALLNPDTIISLATNLKDEQEKRRQAELTIEEQKPKVIFADAYEVSDDLITVKEMANLLKQKGLDTGEVRFYRWLRNNGFVCKKSGDMYNLPTQRSLDLGILAIQKGLRTGRGGALRQTRTTKVTGKGQVYFVNKLLPVNEVI